MLKEQTTLPAGAIIKDSYGNRYQVETLLGKGGFSAVYRVYDRQHRSKIYALKEVINPDEQANKRLLQECGLLQQLHHPALPRVYHVFEYEKLRRVYLLMEYIDGRNLEELRCAQPGQRLPLILALSIMSPIVSALMYMHAQHPPVVHRDIKPSNIIVPADGSEAVLVDFGMAKQYIPESTTTIFRHGSPGYAAIEQYSTSSKTHMRTDVYALGATLYTLLTGRIPADAVSRITAERGKDPLIPANSLIFNIPAHVSRAISRALSVYSHDRFPSVEAFWQALHDDSPEPEIPVAMPDTPIPSLYGEDAEDITPPVALSTSPPIIPRQAPARGNKAAFILALLLPLVLVMGLLGILFYTNHATSRVPTTSSTMTPVSRGALPGPSPTQSTLYPTLSPSYAGTISDTGVANTHTAMYLTRIQQNGSHMSGQFQGLHLVGAFDGTISPTGQVQFTVKFASGVLKFYDGQIKLGGDMQGSFLAVDTQGNSLGEYGPWNVSPSS